MKRIQLEGAVKATLSILVLVFAVVTAVVTGNVWVALAMIASTAGDINIMNSRGCFLTEKNKKYFGWGMISFAVAHLLYILAMEGYKGWSVIVGLELLFCTFVPIMIWGLSKTEENFDPLKSSVLQVIYAICIILAAISALLFHWLTALGYCLFIASDLILSKCEDKDLKYQIAIWATYIPAQICIIASFLIK